METKWLWNECFELARGIAVAVCHDNLITNKQCTATTIGKLQARMKSDRIDSCKHEIAGCGFTD